MGLAALPAVVLQHSSHSISRQWRILPENLVGPNSAGDSVIATCKKDLARFFCKVSESQLAEGKQRPQSEDG
jgi:hypothetical protein